MSKKEFLNLLLIFIVWKILILAFSNLSQVIYPLQTNFLGGGLSNYFTRPFFWGFVNFDGEHYLSISQNGYLPLTYFYFPLYPLITKIAASLFGSSQQTLATAGLIISNLFAVISAVGLYKFSRLFFDENSSYLAVSLLLFFPTGFYLAAFYNESLFLGLTVWSFYFALTKKWFPAFVLCGLATSTRLVGLALIPAIVYEYLAVNKKTIFNLRSVLYGILSSSGIILYMLYLKVASGDFLAFFHNVEIFGGQRSTKLVILPQVFYRYFFKILPAVNYSYFPQVYTTILELSSAILFLAGAYLVYVKMKRSILIYYVLAYIIPTLSGSFSSFPRYALALFPAFIVSAVYMSKKSNSFRISVFTILLLCSLIAVSLFMRGYFVA